MRRITLGCTYSSVFALEDCVKVVQKFWETHGRVPTKKDIDELSKQNMSPSFATFYKFGGLNWVIEQARLTPINICHPDYFPGEAFEQFRVVVREFQKDYGRLPTYAEYRILAKKRDCPSATTLKNHTGKGYCELCQLLGQPRRRGALANLPAGPYK